MNDDENLTNEFTKLIQRGNNLLDRNDLNGAIESYEQALVIKSDPALRSHVSNLKKDLATQSNMQIGDGDNNEGLRYQVGGSPIPREEMNSNKVEHLGNVAKTENPNNQGANDNVNQKEVKTKVHQLLDRARSEGPGNGNWDEALKILREAESLDPSNANIKKMIEDYSIYTNQDDKDTQLINNNTIELDNIAEEVADIILDVADQVKQKQEMNRELLSNSAIELESSLKQEDTRSEFVRYGIELEKSNILNTQTIGFRKDPGPNVKFLTFTLLKKENLYFIECSLLAIENALFGKRPDFDPYCYNENSQLILILDDDQELILNYVDESKCSKPYHESSWTGSFQKKKISGIFKISSTDKEKLLNT